MLNRLLSGPGIALLAGWLAAGLGAAEPRAVTILHTNDLHARLLPLEDGTGGFAELAAVVREERRNCSWCVLVNAGDLVQGSPVSTIYRGLPVYQIGNLFGFDVATIGNHDWDYGWERLREFMKIARYPMVAANIVDGGGALMTGKPYVVKTVNGVRVAFLGAVTEELKTLTTPKLRGPWRAEDVIARVRRYAGEAAKRAELLVLVAHVSEREEQALLDSDLPVPVMVTGHAHRGLERARSANGHVLARVKAYAQELGRLDLKFDPRTRRVESWQWKRIRVEANGVKPAPDVARQVARWEAEVSKVVDVPIGEARRQLDKPAVKALIERAMRERMGADFAFMNMGGVRDILPAGRLLARHVWNIMPFDNKIVMGRFNGSQLPETVTAGRHIDPERQYTLATSDFTAANQGAPGELRSTGLVFPVEGPLLRDAVIEWIRRKKVAD
ncbi:MAG: bifunctional UDP-sugar hydrolase/5'-nucleotidase [Bryobacteraceae bacterium]